MEWRIIRLIVLTSHCALNTILHGVGLFLLLNTYKGGHKTVQHIYMINLSLTKFFSNLTTTIAQGGRLIDRTFKRSVAHQIMLVLQCVQRLQYVPDMVLITGDRVAAIILNLRYRIIFTVQKAKRIVICMWSFYVFLLLLLYILACVTWNEIQWILFCETYFRTTDAINIIYLLFALISYAIMFVAFIKSRRGIARNSNQSSVQISTV